MQFKVNARKHSFDKTELPEQGIKQQFITRYNVITDLNVDNETVGSIQVGDKFTLRCDFEVIAVLKTLVRLGACRNETLAITCREFFKKIVKSNPTYVTRGNMLSCLSDATYEAAQLSLAIREVVKG